MQAKGKIIYWNVRKGYGFIHTGLGKKDLFVHINDFNQTSPRPEVNRVVTYELSSDQQGRPIAAKAALVDDLIRQTTLLTVGSLSVMLAVLYLVDVGIFVLTKRIPPWILALYIVTSLLTFVIYAKDKVAAKLGDWRTSEGTLHLLSLAGGWPGALIAQQSLRHKSNKQSFRNFFWITVLLNYVAFFLLLTPAGSDSLSHLTRIISGL